MNTSPEKRFFSPQEEITWLRKRLEEKKSIEGGESSPNQQFDAGREVMREIETLPDEATGAYRLPSDQLQNHIHQLVDEPHHNQIDELMNIVKEKGVRNALRVARGLKNEHLLDDFHDRLIAEILSQDESTRSL